jgi:hypothetical protein
VTKDELPKGAKVNIRYGKLRKVVVL